MLILFDYFNVEKFAWPPNLQTWGCLTFYALTSGVLTQYFWTKCSVLLGPIAAYSYFSILTFPSLIFFDVEVVDEKLKMTRQYELGAGIIIVCFVVITVNDLSEDIK
jgi:drug/metabolite transporter (DMT)-like permease